VAQRRTLLVFRFVDKECLHLRRPRSVRERIKRTEISNISCLNTRCSYDKEGLLSFRQSSAMGPCELVRPPCVGEDNKSTRLCHEVIATVENDLLYQIRCPMVRFSTSSVAIGEFVSDWSVFACMISDYTSKDCGIIFPSRRLPNLDAG
jgi:hypothetical protein